MIYFCLSLSCPAHGPVAGPPMAVFLVAFVEASASVCKELSNQLQGLDGEYRNNPPPPSSLIQVILLARGKREVLHWQQKECAML